MRKKVLVLVCVLPSLLALQAGCNTTTTIDTRAAEADREAAVKNMNARLNEMDVKLAELKARAERASGEEKTRLEAKWRESAGKREQLARKCEQLQTATANGWVDIRNDAEHTYEELRKSLNQ
jgi:hypothetical protein